MSSVWSNVGSAMSGFAATLKTLGVSAANIPSALGGLMSTLNPNESQELGICSQIIQFMNNPAIEEKLAQQLAMEQGIPIEAATLALTIGQPGVDTPTRVAQIEAIIKAG